MNNEQSKDFNEFFKSEKPRVLNYFLKNTRCPRAEADDKAQECFFSFFKSISSGKYPRNKWTNLLNKIIHNEKINTYRKNSTNKEISLDEENISSLNKKRHNDKEIYNNLGDNNNIFQIRGTCLSPHRSLQEIMLINESKNFHKLTSSFFKNNPKLKKRCKIKGYKFNIINKNENISDFDRDLINDFNGKLLSLAKLLKVNDTIGIDGIKILFSSNNKWHDLYLLSKKLHNKNFQSFDKHGTLIKKKSLKNASKLFFRDFMYYKIGLIKLKKFINFMAITEYPDYIVSEDYIENYFKIGKLNKNTLKKQKWGRTNKDGIVKRIENYNRLISDIDFL